MILLATNVLYLSNEYMYLYKYYIKTTHTHHIYLIFQCGSLDLQAEEVMALNIGESDDENDDDDDEEDEDAGDNDGDIDIDEDGLEDEEDDETDEVINSLKHCHTQCCSIAYSGDK